MERSQDDACENESLFWRISGRLVAVLIGASLLLLTGCSEFVGQDQLHVEPGSGVMLESGHSVGQTFVVRHGGLSGVDVWLEPGQSGPGKIQLHLRADPRAADELATATLPLSLVSRPGFYRFTFSPVADSHGHYVYAFLELQGEESVQVGVGSGNVYLDGALYRNHQPLDAQMSFRLVYDPWYIVLDLGRAAFGGLGLLGVTVLLYVVPGWALLAWLWPRKQLLWAERLGIAAGLSLALYPLLFLWTDLMGLHLGPLYVWLPTIGGLAVLIWRYRSWRPRQSWEALRQGGALPALWPDLALLAVMGAVFAVRLLIIRGLNVPSWGDSVQHAVMTQLMVDNGGLFDSWLPYAPYQTLTVHFGFATVAAALQWSTGLEAAKATLVAGQLINAMAVLTLYPLAVRMGKGNRWVGVGALLVAGLLSPMPAFYVNWGRYAQLAGQAVLPVAMWFLWKAIRTDQSIRQTWKELLLAGGALAGMMLSYYRMPFYYAAFGLVWLLFDVFPDHRWNVQKWAGLVMRLTLVGIVAGMLVLPWLSNVAGGKLATGIGKSMAAPTPFEQVRAEYQMWRDVATYVPWGLIGLSMAAVAWAIIRRQWTVVSPIVGVLILVALPAGRLLHLPGANYMQSFAVAIALYIPVGLLVGWLAGQVIVLLNQSWRWGLALAIVMLLIVMGWGGLNQITIVQPFYRMVFPVDRIAMHWIRENTSSDARFLVNGFTIYDGNSSVGSDAGWWLPLLAGRGNTMPPQYALVNEKPLTPGYTQAVTQLVKDLQIFSPTSREGLRLLCQQAITHVYIGQGEGRIGFEAVPLLSVEKLMTSPSFDLIYQQDRAKVFMLNRQACDRVSVRLATGSSRGKQD